MQRRIVAKKTRNLNLKLLVKPGMCAFDSLCGFAALREALLTLNRRIIVAEYLNYSCSML